MTQSAETPMPDSTTAASQTGVEGNSVIINSATVSRTAPIIIGFREPYLSAALPQ